MSKNEIIINPMLAGKVIYLVATGARKVSLVETMVDAFLAMNATVFVFLTYPAEQMIEPASLKRLLEKCQVRRDFSWYHPNPPLPDEDLVLIAPCTFNSLIKLSLGIADDYALTIASNAVARHKQVLIAPAFNEAWYHPATADALTRLQGWGMGVIYPDITPEKVTMIDVRKVIDYVTGCLNKIKFDSRRYHDASTVAVLHTSRQRYREQFLKYGQQQHATGDNSGLHGCHSVRVNDEWMLVTASGAHLGQLMPEDLTLVRLTTDGSIIDWCGDKAPSSESPLHIDVYAHTQAGAIIHSHNPKLTYAPELQSYATPSYVPYGDRAHTQAVTDQALRQGGFVIMKYHGEVAFGADLDQAAATITAMQQLLKKLPQSTVTQ